MTEVDFGQESALALDSADTPQVSSHGEPASASPEAAGRSEPTTEQLWKLIGSLTHEMALTDHMVAWIVSRDRHAWMRKQQLMALHARGLVTDDQVERAFAEHPELGSRN